MPTCASLGNALLWPMPMFEIIVSRKDLATALNTVTIGLRKGKKGQLRFEHDGFELIVSGPGASHCIDATGIWQGSVRTDAGMMNALARRLPVEDPLTLRANDGRLIVGSLSVSAELLDIAPAAVDLPIGADAVAVLSAVEKYGEVRVRGVTGAATIESARRELGRQLDIAVRALAPYGVTQVDLERLTDATIRRKAGLS